MPWSSSGEGAFDSVLMLHSVGLRILTLPLTGSWHGPVAPYRHWSAGCSELCNMDFPLPAQHTMLHIILTGPTW